MADRKYKNPRNPDRFLPILNQEQPEQAQMKKRKYKTGDKIKYGTPEYNQAYQQGNVYAYYPKEDLYVGQDLPEFTVTAKDTRVKEGISNARSRFLQGAADLIQYPQSRMMQAITGKQENEMTPSQEWGYQEPKHIGHKAANFGINMLLDPVNAVPGIGLYNMTRNTGVKGASKLASPYTSTAKIQSRQLRNIPKTTINNSTNEITSPTLSNIVKNLQEEYKGVKLAIRDMRRGNRPVSEIFPLDDMQVKSISRKQNRAFQEGLEFVEDWKKLPKTQSYINRINTRGRVGGNTVDYNNLSSPTSQARNYLTDTQGKNVNYLWGSDAMIDPKQLSPDLLSSVNKYRTRALGVNLGGRNTALTFRNHGGYFHDPNTIRSTGVHEAGHSLQKERRWAERLAKFNENTQYPSPNLDTKIGREFAELMPEPTKSRAWESSPLEVHSEFMAARDRAVQRLQRDGYTREDALYEVRHPNNDMIDYLYEDAGLSRFFKPDADSDKIRDLLKSLPMVGAAAALSTNKDGSLDGVWGEENKNTLLDWQKRNKPLGTDANQSVLRQR